MCIGNSEVVEKGHCGCCYRFTDLVYGYCTPCLIAYEREEQSREENEASRSVDRGEWIDDDGGISTHEFGRRIP